MDALSGLAQPQFAPWIAAVFGLCIGSFLNVVIHRLPKMMEREWRAQCAELGAPAGGTEGVAADLERFNLMVPRSRCPSCGHSIGALENIPVVSWLILRGKCSACAAPISARYPVVELAAGAAGAYAAWRYGFSLASLGAMAFCWVMIALAFIDLDTQLLPDDLTLPLLWGGLALNLDGTFASLHSAVVGAIAGYLSLWLVYWAFKLATGKEGMGFGDFKLLAAIGAWLGWQALPLVILLSSVVGAAAGISLMLFTKHGRDHPIPFGPYLAAAGLIALFWGAEITQRWLPLAG
ncbi:MAG: A24 family peptidase [Burkholderiales bacterium]|jgi:leader peptidase (prepilin peptidase)/N-methyltransferase